MDELRAADNGRMEPVSRVGDAQAHLPVGAHARGHGRGAGGVLPLVVDNTGFGIRKTSTCAD